VESPCEHDNEPSGCIKGASFLEQLSENWLLRKHCALEFVINISVPYTPMKWAKHLITHT